MAEQIKKGFENHKLSLVSKNMFTSINNFEYIKDPIRGKVQLGMGSFGEVKLAKDKRTGKKYAIKIVKNNWRLCFLINSRGNTILIDIFYISIQYFIYRCSLSHILAFYKSKMSLKTMRSMLEVEGIEREIRVHSSLNHPHIIQFYDSFQEGELVYIVLGYASNGNLFSHLFKKKAFSEKEAFKFFNQTCLAIEYLHSINIVHRDLKPENILLDEDLNVKVCDFGWCTEDIENPRSTFCGTYEYMAPEIVFRQEYDYRIDVWALGVLLFELLHGNAPFKGKSFVEIQKKVEKGDIKFSENIGSNVKSLICRVLQANPSKRISIKDILNHRWMKEMKNEGPQSEVNIKLNQLPQNDSIQSTEKNNFGIKEQDVPKSKVFGGQPRKVEMDSNKENASSAVELSGKKKQNTPHKTTASISKIPQVPENIENLTSSSFYCNHDEKDNKIQTNYNHGYVTKNLSSKNIEQSSCMNSNNNNEYITSSQLNYKYLPYTDKKNKTSDEEFHLVARLFAEKSPRNDLVYYTKPSGSINSTHASTQGKSPKINNAVKESVQWRQKNQANTPSPSLSIILLQNGQSNNNQKEKKQLTVSKASERGVLNTKEKKQEQASCFSLFGCMGASSVQKTRDSSIEAFQLSKEDQKSNQDIHNYENNHQTQQYQAISVSSRPSLSFTKETIPQINNPHTIERPRNYTCHEYSSQQQQQQQNLIQSQSFNQGPQQNSFIQSYQFPANHNGSQCLIPTKQISLKEDSIISHNNQGPFANISNPQTPIQSNYTSNQLINFSNSSLMTSYHNNSNFNNSNNNNNNNNNSSSNFIGGRSGVGQRSRTQIFSDTNQNLSNQNQMQQSKRLTEYQQCQQQQGFNQINYLTGSKYNSNQAPQLITESKITQSTRLRIFEKQVNPPLSAKQAQQIQKPNNTNSNYDYTHQIQLQ